MKLSKMLVGGIVAFAMLAPFAASAASISNPLFSTGQTSIDANGSQTVNGTFTLTVGSGEVVEWLRVQSDPSQPFVDTSVGGTLGYQEGVYTGVPFSTKVTPNTGTIYPTVQGAGIFGGSRSINGGDNVVLGSSGLGTVRVVANSSTTGSTFDVSDQNAFLAWFMTHYGTPTAPAPVANPGCAALSAKLSGTVDNTYNDANIRLQGYLLSEGASIPALAAGASFGYKGPQTRSAVTAFQVSHGCN